MNVSIADQSVEDFRPPLIYTHPSPYIPLNKLSYFTSQDALPKPDLYPDHYGIDEQVQILKPVSNELDVLQKRRKRETVHVVMAESASNYDDRFNFNDLYNSNFSSNRNTSVTDHNSTTSADANPIRNDTVAIEKPAIEWSTPIENESTAFGGTGLNSDWAPQSYQVGQDNNRPSYDFQSIKQQINSHKKRLKQGKDKIPHFQVTYWMFYPYSQGKTMCSISLGPLGRLPIPLIFGMCLGTRKDFGSHVGDWEHMSLNFKGSTEPDVSLRCRHGNEYT